MIVGYGWLSYWGDYQEKKNSPPWAKVTAQMRRVSIILFFLHSTLINLTYFALSGSLKLTLDVDKLERMHTCTLFMTIYLYMYNRWGMITSVMHLARDLSSLETFLKENCYFDGRKAIKEDSQAMLVLPPMDASLRYQYNLVSSLLVFLDHLLKLLWPTRGW